MPRFIKHRTVRFAAVGCCNAAISFGLLNLAYYQFHTTKIAASIFSTTCAFIFSFVLNRSFVFGDKASPIRKQAPKFVLVTASGSLGVLNLVYILSVQLLKGHETFIITAVHALTHISLSQSFVSINVSTVIGAVVALFWNYNGYKWFVFKGNKHVVGEAQLTI